MKKKLKLEVLNRGQKITEVAPTRLQRAVGGGAVSVDDGDGGGGSNIGCGGPASCFT